MSDDVAELERIASHDQERVRILEQSLQTNIDEVTEMHLPLGVKDALGRTPEEIAEAYREVWKKRVKANLEERLRKARQDAEQSALNLAVVKGEVEP